jgi:integrase
MFGDRRGEALGLKWEDIDFDRGRINIRRSITRRRVSTPKNGRGRHVVMSADLASCLFDLLAARRREALANGWQDTPQWVFCSETGGAMDERNFERVWLRVRRRAQKEGVRPLKLHYTRHTFASLALASGKSVRWVADQLGHASPMLTLKTYAHALREEEADLSFLQFDGPRRPDTALDVEGDSESENAHQLTTDERSRLLEHETGFGPATLTLAT